MTKEEIVRRLTKERWADHTEFEEALSAMDTLNKQDRGFVEHAITTYLNNKYYKG